MTTYTCPEFAATGLEMQIIEEEARREEAVSQGWLDIAARHQAEIGRLWSELSELTEHDPFAA